MRLPERVLAWRDRLLLSPGFQRFAARFPLTRPIAARHAGRLFDYCAGFVYSQILLALVELDILEKLKEAPRSLDDLAKMANIAPERLARLLKAGAALGLIEMRGDTRFGLGLLGAALLGNPGALRMIAHHRLLYADLADPVALLRGAGDEPAIRRFWGYGGAAAPNRAGDAAAYSRLMAESLSLVAGDILDAFPLNGFRSMLDIGGGLGGFAQAAVRRFPQLDVRVCDLPAVVSAAESQPRQARIRFVAADAMDGDLPSGADLVSFIRVLHDHDDDVAATMLDNSFRALEPGGTILIGEPMGGRADTAAMADAYFGFYFLAMGSGRARAPAEYAAMLAAAGFVDIRIPPTRRPLLASVVVARKRS